MAASSVDFFSDKNEAMLDRLVYSDFQRRTSGDLNDVQKIRLVKTVKHYMKEIYDNNNGSSIVELNKEVLKMVVSDFGSYLNRASISATSDIDSRMVERNEPVRSDVGSRFNALQNERNGGNEQKRLMPPAPDFRIPIEDSNDSPALALFEMAKKNREAEAKREAAQAPQIVSKLDDGFSGTFLKDLIQESSGSGIAIANPTIAKPEVIRIKPALPQDTIIPQDEILSYKENEYNLVVYSADRDWYNNQRENRYNFSVTFNPANNSQGFKYSPSANMRFHNITRIEMVKALVPYEQLDLVITNTGNSTTPAYDTTTKNNALAYPGIILHVDELDSNVFGTDDTLDRAFASLQYDAQWSADTTTLNPSFLAMIPKFLKCQRTYYPTPLATLTKMTIQLQLPNGNPINTSLDTLNVNTIFSSLSPPLGFTSASVYIGTGVKDSNNNSIYFILQTSTYFSRYLFAKGDRIAIQGINVSLISNNLGTKDDWAAYLQATTGLLVVGTGYTNGTVYTDGPNSVGYCNFIVIESRFNDPTTGSTTIMPFGGTNASSQSLESAINSVTFTGTRLLNLSKQVQLTFRVITRDMDSATRIRPNNA
jgi:hypothetical protein